MTDTQSESSYIREITDYFCSLAGKVAIISSEETQILVKWKREGIPKQDVLRGIKKAFESGSMPAKVKISGCRRFVEECFHKSRSQTAVSGTVPGGRPFEVDTHSIIQTVSRNIGSAARKADDENVRKCLEKAGETLAGLAGGESDVDGFLKTLRRRVCGELIAGFDSARAGRVKKHAREMFPPGRNFINEEERARVFTDFMDDLIMREAGIAGLFSPVNEVEEDGEMR